MRDLRRLIALSATAAVTASAFIAVSFISATSSAAAPKAGATTTALGGYVAIAPTRLLDTRTGNGAAKHALTHTATVTVQITGRASIPSDATAVALNITVTGPTGSGFITAWGNGTRPIASNVNYSRGQTIANAAIIPVDDLGKITFYNGSGGTTQLIADVTGYYTAGMPTAAGALSPINPTRLLDTRIGTGAAKHALAPRATLTLTVVGRAGVAAGAVAAVLNVTASAPTGNGYLTVWGNGAHPSTSNLNFVKGQTVANLVITPIASDGTVHLLNSSSGTVQLIADISGYFLGGTPTTQGTLTSLTPARLLDTRHNSAFPSTGVRDFGTVTLPVAGQGGVPTTGVAAAVLNVTATGATSNGFVTTYASGTTLPSTSTLNYTKGTTVANLVIAPISADGKVALFTSSPGTTHVVVDVFGYILGSPSASWSAVAPTNEPDAVATKDIRYFGVSCPTAGSCGAVGFYDRSSGKFKSLLATLSGGTWTQSLPPLPADADPAANIEVESISCPSAGNCIAVGFYTDLSGDTEGLIETLAAGSWSASTLSAPADALSNSAQLYGLSCTSTTACVASGAYLVSGTDIPGLIVTLAGGTWTATAAPVPDGLGQLEVDVETVSCKASSCAAVGQYDTVADPDTELALVFTRTGGSWSASVPSAPVDGTVVTNANDVSCSASGSCVLVGSYTNDSNQPTGMVSVLSGGVWTPTSVPLDAQNRAISSLYSVSCPTTAFCGVAGQHLDLTGVVGSGSAATWSATSLLYPSDNVSGGALSQISCPAANSCVGVGYYYGPRDRYRALTETLTGSTWTTSPAANPTVDPSLDSWTQAVSCTATNSFCAAVGTTVDRLSHMHGLLETFTTG